MLLSLELNAVPNILASRLCCTTRKSEDLFNNALYLATPHS